MNVNRIHIMRIKGIKQSNSLNRVFNVMEEYVMKILHSKYFKVEVFY